MKRLLLVLAVPALMALSLTLSAQQSAPDVILTNGKIVTVDAQFTVAQAVAVRGDRFVAVGTNQDITRLAGPRHPAHRLAGPHGRARSDRQPRALPGGGRVLESRAALRRRRLAQAGARADPRQGEGEGAGPVGLQPGRLVARSVRGRQATVHARGARSVLARQPGVPAVQPRRDVPQQQGDRGHRARQDEPALDSARRQRPAPPASSTSRATAQ